MARHQAAQVRLRRAIQVIEQIRGSEEITAQVRTLLRIGLGDQAQGMGAIEAHAPEQREQLIVRLGLTCQQGRPAGTGQVHQGPPGRQCVRVCAHGAGALGRLNHHAASRGASA